MWNNVLARSETVSKPIVNSGVSGPQKMRACDQAQNCKGDVRPTLLARADEVIEQDCCSLHLLTAASGPLQMPRPPAAASAYWGTAVVA
jgi:hypothetical protein